MLIARVAELCPPVLAGEAQNAFRVVGVSSEDVDAPNWTVRTNTPIAQWRHDVARVVKQLQLEYVLEAEDF